MKEIVQSTETETATLALSENFYSVQCEGVSTGYPAYFIRLKGCNLICGGSNGALMKRGKATWWCHSEAVWRQGEQTHLQVLIDDWLKEDILDWVLSGRVHLIWTGGEPTLLSHQHDIVNCINHLRLRFGPDRDINLYNEIETNGTQWIDNGLFEELDQINCSVKLANSGMPYKKRFCELALERIMSHKNYWFKFVISSEEDMDEIQKDFIDPLKIPANRILMMPGLDHQDNFHERTEFCLQMAKKYGYIGMTRLHISAWNQTTGV